MKWLLWREYRLNFQLLIAGAALLVLPYLFTLGVFLWPTAKQASGSQIAEGFAVAAVVSYALSQITIALLGGHIFAGERGDRSAEFMAYVPVSKNRRLLSKLSLTTIVTALVWSINLLVLWSLHNLVPWQTKPSVLFDAKTVALTGLMMFCVAYFISALQSSPSFAACGGLATPLIIMIGLSIAYELAYEEWNSQARNRFMDNGYSSISLALSAVCFTLGTWYYLKRLEP
jgi:ABC-type transport system involved in multi-copper enzyme maturation permease subunit